MKPTCCPYGKREAKLKIGKGLLAAAGKQSLLGKSLVTGNLNEAKYATLI
jgi:hypothetical protein